MLYTVSGVPREKFSQFPMPRNTEVFGPTFAGKTLMSDDITKDPRYGKNAPYYGYPKDHLPVRSYLAVSVKSSTGEVIGALFYGHSLPGRFGELEKKLIEGLAPQAAIAIDNARLYQASERALASREEFVSIASHELKTPITSMSIQFQIAEKMINSNNARVYEPQAVTKRVKTALQQLARMTKLIEDMLDSSRIDMNKFKLNKNVFDFNLMIKSLLEKYAEQFQVENIEVTTSLPESPLMVNGDDYRLEQVVSNLINNAIKYGQHRPISITLSQTGGNVVLSVMDNGMGISPENLPRIFNRYERAISHSNISGLGLGLYISKMIVEAHGGTISAESVPEKGSVFKVVIPTE
jgi:signal transduction histidine kinase